MRKIVIVMLLAVLAWQGYERFASDPEPEAQAGPSRSGKGAAQMIDSRPAPPERVPTRTPVPDAMRAIDDAPSPSFADAPQPEPLFQCDGRTHCSHMHSCEEALYFLNNCPDTQMDGDNDGVPCERQWCRH
jgi:hypothetical protein